MRARRGEQLVSSSGVGLGYFHGDDGYGLERAADALIARLASAFGPVERWRVSSDIPVGRIAERVATGSLFGGGTVAVVSDPGVLVRSKEDRETLAGMLASVAPGNGIVFLESSEGSRRPKALVDLATAVEEAGGEVRQLRAPAEGQLSNWIEQRAGERGIALSPGAARELATRVGGFVREGDVDRRRQGQLAVAELEKLGLYRPAAPVTAEDVRALVAEAVPGSTWAFLDAVALRRVAVALDLLDRLIGSVPELVLLSQLHRRIKDLILVGDHLAAGARPGSLVATLKLNPYRAERLVQQARLWSLPELDAALHGLLELDAAVRGAGGATSEAGRRLQFTLWVAEHAARPS
jgi:DNA polymerase III delta subunit